MLRLTVLMGLGGLLRNFECSFEDLVINTVPRLLRLHSPKPTWKPIQPLFKGTVVFIMGFHVSFREGKASGSLDVGPQTWPVLLEHSKGFMCPITGSL